MSATTDIFAATACTPPPIRTNIAVSGLLTSMNAVVPRIDQLEDIFKEGGEFRLLSPQFAFAWEGKACQAEQSNFFDFLNATAVDLSKNVPNKEMGQSGLLEIAPFVNVKRIGPINNNSWAALSGAAALVDGTLDEGGAYWQMRFSSPTGIPLDAGWFIPKEWVFVTGLDESGNNIHWAGEVVHRTVNGTTDIVVTMAPRMGTSNLPSARKANPLHGRATRGVANVNKFESFCAQPPGLLTNQVEKYWLGWARQTFRSDSLYEKWRALVFADNRLYKEFFDLPLAEYNKQVVNDFKRKHVESFFNNTKLAGQNQTDWSKTPAAGGLPIIYTSPDSPGGARPVGRYANPEGIFEQHVACQRAVDAQGAKLNLPALFQEFYKMQRIREASGGAKGAQQVFEIGMPQNYFPKFQQGMLELYDAQWKGKVNWNFELNNQGNKAQVSPMGFMYFEFILHFPVGMRIRVVLDKYFDDYAAEMENMATLTGNANYANLGRRLWIMDWSRIWMGITDSKTVSNSPGKDMVAAQNLQIFDPCVMESVVEYITMHTWQWTAVADCPSGNLIIENLSDEVPEHANIGDVDYSVNA